MSENIRIILFNNFSKVFKITINLSIFLNYTLILIGCNLYSNQKNFSLELILKRCSNLFKDYNSLHIISQKKLFKYLKINFLILIKLIIVNFNYLYKLLFSVVYFYTLLKSYKIKVQIKILIF